jgi:RNA polymerase sigma factor (sigma-70 family)
MHNTLLLAAEERQMTKDWSITFDFNPFIIGGMKPLNIPTVSAPATPSKHASRNNSATSPATKPNASMASTVSKPARATELPAAEDDASLRDYLGAISKNDQAALAHFYDLTVSRVYSIALRIVRHVHLAEEVVSDVYMQVWRDAHRYDDSRGRVLGWLLIITRSRALDLLRRQDEAFSHPEPYELISEPESEQKSAHDLLEAAQAGTALHEAMQALTPLQRQLLSLAFFRGLSHSEIVEQSGIPLGSVKTHIRRALTALKSKLGQNMQLDN